VKKEAVPQEREARTDRQKSCSLTPRDRNGKGRGKDAQEGRTGEKADGRNAPIKNREGPRDEGGRAQIHQWEGPL